MGETEQLLRMIAKVAQRKTASRFNITGKIQNKSRANPRLSFNESRHRPINEQLIIINCSLIIINCIDSIHSSLSHPGRFAVAIVPDRVNSVTVYFAEPTEPAIGARLAFWLMNAGRSIPKQQTGTLKSRKGSRLSCGRQMKTRHIHPSTS